MFRKTPRAFLCIATFAAVALAQEITAPLGGGGGGGGSGCVPAGSVGQLLIDSGAGACSSSGDFTISTHTLAGGASAVLDLHLMATSAFKVPGGFVSGLLHVTTATGATAGGLLVNADIGNASIDPAKLVGGTFGAGDYVFPGNVAVGTTVTVNGATGAIVTSGPITSGNGSGAAGAVDMAQGTAPTVVANTITDAAPASVTGQVLLRPGAANVANQFVLYGAPSSSTSTGAWATFVSTSLSDTALLARLASPTFTGTVTLPSGQALIAPNLGTVASGVLTGATGLPAAGVVGTAAILGANTFTGAQINSTAGALSAPAASLTGTAVSGGSATTTKPLYLIEPTGTTSTNWSTSGTYFGMNLPSGFTAGDMVNWQLNNVSVFKLTATGFSTANLSHQGNYSASGNLSAGAGGTVGFAGRSALTSSADGLISMANLSNNGFTRLNLGVSASTSFPALGITSQTNPILKVQDANGGDTADLQIGHQKSTTGTVPACFDTTGKLVATPAGCSGT